MKHVQNNNIKLYDLVFLGNLVQFKHRQITWVFSKHSEMNFSNTMHQKSGRTKITGIVGDIIVALCSFYKWYIKINIYDILKNFIYVEEI